MTKKKLPARDLRREKPEQGNSTRSDPKAAASSPTKPKPTSAGLGIWFQRLGSDYATGLRRFPVSLALSATLTLLLILLNHLPDGTPQAITDDWLRAIIACIMGLPVSLGIHLWLERLQRPPAYRPIHPAMGLAAFLPAAAGLVAYAWFLLPELDHEPMIRAILLTVAFILVFFCIPHAWRRDGIASHVTRILIRGLVTVLYAGILMLSLFAILFTLDQLLGVNIRDTHYLDTAMLVWALFAPFHLFAGIPGVREVPKPTDSPKTLRFLLHWILMPLLLAYTAILYLYSAKILLERQWPHGIVTSLILSWICIGLLVWFLSSFTKEDNRLAGVFHIAFPWAALPLFGILFTAIGIRISDYGITEERWFVLLLAGWCAAATLFLALRSLVTRRNPEDAGMRLILLPATLAVVVILSVVGPTSASSVSIGSQNRQLETLLARNGMLMDGKVQKASGEVSAEDADRIGSILRWFEDAHTLSDVRSMPPDMTMERMAHEFGIPSSIAVTEAQPVDYRRYALMDNPGSLTIDGYDRLFFLSGSNQEQTDAASGLTVRTSALDQRVDVLRQKEVIGSLSLTEVIRQLENTAGLLGEKGEVRLTREQLTFESRTGELTLRLMISELNGMKTEEGFRLDHLDGWLLVDLKYIG